MNRGETDFEVYRQELEAQLDGWEAEIDQLSERIDEAGEDARISYGQRLEMLRNMVESVRKTLHKSAQVDARSQEGLRADIDRDMVELERRFDDVVTALNDIRRFP